ncbi:MAG: phosphoglycerate dehydrogenase [Spirochaetales bacterium]|nr:phosphoglycerate dehydrogenase [Spirochaetales bacterium]MCF7938768.1 phosphoglycerate dehydrogenase [Spirochaetales bacterium]
MYTIATFNKIAPRGLELFPSDQYRLIDANEAGAEKALAEADGILLRSYKLRNIDIPPNVKGIGRAGAGVNNIDVEQCTEKGIVVFNTPGANANSVKELVLTGLFISSRKIIRGLEWTKELSKEDDVQKLVEKEKSRFVGPEIKGKQLGVIGLGAIGVSVANAAVALGMEVTGYDPFISVEAAWGLSSEVKRAQDINKIYQESDYITVHVPLNEKTEGFLNYQAFSKMKPGVKILNFARGPLVNNEDIIKACEEGIIDRYVTDFPTKELLGYENVMTIPHLGASTPEAEENCAVMAATQLKNYLEYGTIRNSVNFPHCVMERNGEYRLLVGNKNIPNMVGQISTVLAEAGINISEMINKHRETIAYNIIDVEGPIYDSLIKKLEEIEGVFMVRLIKPGSTEKQR